MRTAYEAPAARRSARGGFALHLVVGAALGILFLHPATMVIYWLEFRPEPTDLVSFLSSRMAASASPEMLAMNGLFLLLGAAVGGVFGAYHRVLAARKRVLHSLAHELGTDVRALIEGGENERTEFKSTARWDLRQQKPSKDIESALVKTVAGFLNHRGGSLLLGVSDAREVVGLGADYRTLKNENRDGFERFLMTLIKERLGGNVCSFVHPVFVDLDGADVCRLVVEPSDQPVYCSDRDGARYFLRTGNATRELDVREAVEHIQLRERNRARRARSDRVLHQIGLEGTPPPPCGERRGGAGRGRHPEGW